MEGGPPIGMYLYSYLSLYVCVVFVFVCACRICLCMCVLYLSLYVCVIAGGHHGGAPQAQGHQVQPLLQADAFEPGS